MRVSSKRLALNCWKGKRFKLCSFSQKHKKAGRNSSGRITIFHRGGGSKRLLRRIDFKRNILNTGIVERIEYDPNRSARIALIKWTDPIESSKVIKEFALRATPQHQPLSKLQSVEQSQEAYFSYILACDKLELQATINNCFTDKIRLRSSASHNSNSTLKGEEKQNGELESLHLSSSAIDKMYQQVGNCIPLELIPIGTFVHNIEQRPGQGGQLVRAAGTFAQLVQKVENTQQSIIRLPSGILKQLDSKCRATIGIVSNTSHNTIKLTKAGQNRWLGKRPIVRGVAMNPIDHPHGGGEGRSKGGRPSVSPWGKPTKGGYKTVRRKQGYKL